MANTWNERLSSTRLQGHRAARQNLSEIVLYWKHTHKGSTDLEEEHTLKPTHQSQAGKFVKEMFLLTMNQMFWHKWVIVEIHFLKVETFKNVEPKLLSDESVSAWLVPDPKYQIWSYLVHFQVLVKWSTNLWHAICAPNNDNWCNNCWGLKRSGFPQLWTNWSNSAFCNQLWTNSALLVLKMYGRLNLSRINVKSGFHVMWLQILELWHSLCLSLNEGCTKP